MPLCEKCPMLQWLRARAGWFVALCCIHHTRLFRFFVFFLHFQLDFVLDRAGRPIARRRIASDLPPPGLQAPGRERVERDRRRTSMGVIMILHRGGTATHSRPLESVCVSACTNASHVRTPTQCPKAFRPTRLTPMLASLSLHRPAPPPPPHPCAHARPSASPEPPAAPPHPPAAAVVYTPGASAPASKGPQNVSAPGGTRLPRPGARTRAAAGRERACGDSAPDVGAHRSDWGALGREQLLHARPGARTPRDPCRTAL
jgi:hypothetical protein